MNTYEIIKKLKFSMKEIFINQLNQLFKVDFGYKIQNVKRKERISQLNGHKLAVEQFTNIKTSYFQSEYKSFIIYITIFGNLFRKTHMQKQTKINF